MHSVESITSEEASKVRGEVGTTAQLRNQSLNSFNSNLELQNRVKISKRYFEAQQNISPSPASLFNQGQEANSGIKMANELCRN